MTTTSRVICLVLSMVLVAPVFAQDVPSSGDKKHYSPNVGDTFPNNVFFGYTHLHTSYSNSIGDAYQQAYWKDPAFDATQKAFYYVRVIEIPTPRWTVYDAKHFGRELPEGVPISIQERAYTSPIWYTPK